MEKKCIKCNEVKPIAEFNKHIRSKDGTRNSCRLCDSIYKKEWKKNNPDKVKEQKKRYKKNNPDKVKEQKKRYKKNNPDKIREQKKKSKKKHLELRNEKFRKGTVESGTKVCNNCKIEKPVSEYYASSYGKCKECEKLRMKIYRMNHPDRRKLTKDKWKKNNPEQNKLLKKNHRNRRKKRDPVYRAMMSMRSRTTSYGYKKFNTKRNKFSEIIGIDPEGFREYIASKFKEGMSWDNYSWHTWHLDHIIPLSKATTIQELEELCHYTNLQPLWKDENFEKSNKIL